MYAGQRGPSRHDDNAKKKFGDKQTKGHCAFLLTNPNDQRRAQTSIESIQEGKAKEIQPAGNGLPTYGNDRLGYHCHCRRAPKQEPPTNENEIGQG
jgi:hypothetical protein